jgi:hypothetical protein
MDIAPIVLESWLGDPLSAYAINDLFEEGEMKSPFANGEKWLVSLNTLYYVGEITEVEFNWIKMKNASWVHWTGKLSVLLSLGFNFEEWPEDARKPRTEYVGDVVLGIGTNMAAAYPWTFDLPTESIAFEEN